MLAARQSKILSVGREASGAITRTFRGLSARW